MVAEALIEAKRWSGVGLRAASALLERLVGSSRSPSVHETPLATRNARDFEGLAIEIVNPFSR